MTSKKHMKMQLKWAATDLAKAGQDRDEYVRRYRSELSISTRLQRTIRKLRAERDTVKLGSTVRYYVEMTVQDELFDDFNAKDINLINHWIKNKLIDFEDATFVITRQNTVEIDSSGRTQADRDYLNRPMYGYSGLSIPARGLSSVGLL